MARFVLPLLLLISVAAQAQTPTATPVSDLGGSVLQLFLGLAGAIGMLLGSLWLLKKLVTQRGEASGLMKVVAGTAVGTRERVVIVEIGTTWLVLGVAPGRVSALAEVPRQALPVQSSPASTANFPDWLRRMTQRK